jgi:hypothetical protein
MKIVFTPRRRARLLAAMLALVCASALPAQPSPYIGRWLPDAPPAVQASRTSLTIKAESLSWRGPDKSTRACTRAFVLKNEKPGTVYRNGRGKQFIAGAKGSLPTYLLMLDANADAGSITCDNPATEMRISFHMVYDIDHIEVIDYVNGKPVSVQHFHRRKK